MTYCYTHWEAEGASLFNFLRERYRSELEFGKTLTEQLLTHLLECLLKINPKERPNAIQLETYPLLKTISREREDTLKLELNYLYAYQRIKNEVGKALSENVPVARYQIMFLRK